MKKNQAANEAANYENGDDKHVFYKKKHIRALIEKIGFNLSDYDYMDTMPLAGWVWEFMRRSDEYNKFWRDNEGIPDFYVGDKIWYGKAPSEKWTTEDSEYLGFSFYEVVSKFKPVDVTNMKFVAVKDHYEPDYVRLKITSVEKAKKILGLSEPSPQKGTTSAEKFYQLLHEGALEPDEVKKSDRLELRKHSSIEKSSESDGYGITQHLKYYLFYGYPDHPFEKLSKVIGKRNVVMALIDASTPESIDNLLLTIKKELLFWRKRLRLQKVRDAKVPRKNKNELIKNAKIWKSYLIVYDLLKKGITPSEATGILSDYDDQYAELKIVIRHNDRANALINGEYKEYL